MPKHRQPGFAVVREIEVGLTDPFGNHLPTWAFHGIVGVYFSTDRADEVVAATMQKYLDQGMNPEFPEFRCKVHPTTYYDE